MTINIKSYFPINRDINVIWRLGIIFIFSWKYHIYFNLWESLFNVPTLSHLDDGAVFIIQYNMSVIYRLWLTLMKIFLLVLKTSYDFLSPLIVLNKSLVMFLLQSTCVFQLCGRQWDPNRLPSAADILRVQPMSQRRHLLWRVGHLPLSVYCRLEWQGLHSRYANTHWTTDKLAYLMFFLLCWRF